jgi:hypothetical protein
MMLATVFGVLGFKEPLAVKIESVLVPVLGPLSLERFDLCWCRDAEPAPGARIIALTLTRGTAMELRRPHLGQMKSGEEIYRSDLIS